MSLSIKNCVAGFAKLFPKLNENLSLPSVLFLSVLAAVFGISINIEFIMAQSDPILGIAVTGDIHCGDQGKNTINKIEEYQANGTVDKVLWLGDLSYKKTQNCFFEESNRLPINDTLAVVGNHDDTEDGANEEEEDNIKLRNQTLEKYGLPAKGYYNRTWHVTDPQSNSSNDVLVIGMYTHAEFEEDSDQFNFIKKTLNDNANLSKPAPLIIVMMHKPMVTCKCEHPKDDDDKLPDARRYHPLFAQFGVDLVLQGHNHNVQYYDPVDGVMYILSGAGGKGHHVFDNNEKFPRSGTGISNITKTYSNDDTFGFTLLEANFDTNELKGSLISNRGTPESGSNFTMQFAD